MQGVKAGGQTCPHCFRSFRGTQGPAHDRFLQPLLLRCGHTFCQGCISKQVKVLKTSIACSTCQVVTPMPLGEASIKQLPANYYMLGLATWSSRQLMDMFDQKVEFQSPSKLSYEAVHLEGDRVLCKRCHRVLATCQCKQCDDTYCEPCFIRLHRGSRTLQTHTAVPFGSSKGRGGCKEHDNREFEFFCIEDEVPICALCALMGTHKGHDIIQLSDQDKEAFKELKPVFEIAKKVLKHQYYAMQMTRDTKRDVRKELTDLADVIKASFARLHAVLQLREHGLLEQIVGIAAQQTQYLGAMLTSIEGNICILESAMIDAMTSLEDDSTIPANVTKLVHTLKSSQTLPSHVVVPVLERQQPLSHFTYSSDVVSSLMSFGTVKVTLKPRLELKTDSDLPEDWEAPEISEDVLSNSAICTYKKDKVTSPRNKTNASSVVHHFPDSPRTSPGETGHAGKHGKGKAVNAAIQLKKGESTPRSETSKEKESKLVRSHLSPRSTNVLARELVRVTHIRNPCCFYIQRESDQSQLSSMMVRINRDCKLVPQSKRLPQDLSNDALCCCLYDTDKTWYRVRIKSITYPDPEVATPTLTPPTSPRLTPVQSPEETPQPSPLPTVEDDSEGARDNEIADSLSESKSEVGSEVGSETSSDVSQDVSFEVKQTVKPDTKPEVKPKISADEPKVDVLYVDYGNSETVALSKLCKLKEKYHDVPDMAVCCSLTDIVPTRKSGRWSVEAVHSFAKMVGDKAVYMSILGHSGATLYVDLHKPPILEVENDMPISLRDAMVFLELACFVSPDSVPEAAPSRGPPLKFISADLPVQGEEIVVTVSHFQDPQCFCVQEIGADCEYLLKMMKDLQEAYTKKLDDRWNILCPKMGDICVAHFSEDKQWSRAEIVGLPGNQEVDVLYVDYGNYERVHCSKLQKISKKFLKLCVQALPCSLADISPKDAEKGWTDEENEGFGQVVLTKALRATVKGIEEGRLSIILVEDRQDREINMNALMVQKGFAQSTGPGSVSAAIIFDIPHSDFSDDDTLKNEDTPSSDSGTDAHPSIPKTNGVHQPFGSSSPQKSQLSPKLSSQYTAVHISHVESPACIYIQLSTAGKDGLDSLLEAMTLTYKQSETIDDTTWQEGDLCGALLVREGAWCRGRIKTVLPDDNAVILFTDYGNTEVVSVSNIRPLVEKFQKDPPFAIQCHLADVLPGGDKQKWTKTACEFLAGMLSDLECVIVKKGDLLKGSLPIDLLYERSIEEKLEQQTVEDFGSISKLLLLKGLALPVKRVTSKSPIKPPSTDQQLSATIPQTSQNITSSPPRPSNLLPNNSASNPHEKPPQLNSQSMVFQGALGEVGVNAQSGDIPRYQSPPLPTSGRMDLVITYVSPDGIISGLQATEVGTFRDVMERLQAANATRQTSPEAADLHEGQAVCAQFLEDNLWYRARVIRVYADTVEVHYVDFGNSDVIPLSSIHQKPFMLTLPQQSRDCVLIALKPKPPSTSWPTATIQYLLENLVEQACTALIKSLCKKGEPLKVDFLLPTGQSVTNLLLVQGLAENDEPDDGDQCNPYTDEEESGDAAMATPNEKAVSPEVGIAMAGLEAEYRPMRLPAKGSRLAVSVTHINQPDMVYIQPWADQLHGDPVQLETYHQIVQLQRMSAGLNKMASSLPCVNDPQPGLCCCTLYQVNQQWFRTVIRQVKEAEKLCEVQFVDYGTSEWVPTKG